MLHCFDFVRELNMLSITVRLVTAVICGGVIGIEREYKRRPAGFRTHILICLGAAMTTLTSQHLLLTMHLYNDVSRLGAGVVGGISFIGAGTIIVTNRQYVKGLTTAAGLWTSAIIGLCCGAGFIECALFGTLMVLFAEILLIKLEYRFARTLKDINLYIEYANAQTIEQIVRLSRDNNIKVSGLEITRATDPEGALHYHAVLSVQTKQKQEDQLISDINAIDDVIKFEEL